jgi:hypothetical protein
VAGSRDANVWVVKIDKNGNYVNSVTIVGTSGTDRALGITLDALGNVWITGYTAGGFPIVGTNPVQSTYMGGGHDAFVTEVRNDLSGLLYSTYVGGSGEDFGGGIARMGSDFVVVGSTWSPDFNHWTTLGYDHALGGMSDSFAVRIHPGVGTPVYTTYIGGTSLEGDNIATGEMRFEHVAAFLGQAFVVGTTVSQDFFTDNVATSVLANTAYDSILNTGLGGQPDAYLMRLDGSGAPTYATFVGGSSSEFGTGVSIAGVNRATVAGFTSSSDFPRKGPSSSLGGSVDGFVTIINLATQSLSCSRYLGGSDTDRIWGLSGGGAPLVSGTTASTDFPTVNPYDATHNGGNDAFVTAMNADCTICYSTYLGGAAADEGRAIAPYYSLQFNAPPTYYVAGFTASSDFPTTVDLYGGGEDAFVTALGGCPPSRLPFPLPGSPHKLSPPGAPDRDLQAT